MQTVVSILRELWRRRPFVALFAIAAVVAGSLVMFQPSFPPKSKKVSLGTANARILIDTPDSQVVAIASKDAVPVDLGAHASLLSQLMTQGDAKAAIAKRAGMNPDKLAVVAPSTAPGAPAASLDYAH